MIRVEEGIDEDTVEVEVSDTGLNDVVKFTVSVEDDETRRDCEVIRVEEGIDEDTVEVKVCDNEFNKVVEVKVSGEVDETR